MIPVQLREEIFPPLKARRSTRIEELSQKRFDLLVLGATSLARETLRLASHNSLQTAYLCEGDYVAPSESVAPSETQHLRNDLPRVRRVLSEILSARYDGALDLNHVEILQVTQRTNDAVEVSCRCKLSAQQFVLRCGAVINETGQILGQYVSEAARARRAQLSSAEKKTRFLNCVITEHGAVFRFVAGIIRKLSIQQASLFLMRKIAQAAHSTRSFAGLNGVPLIDSIERKAGNSQAQHSFAQCQVQDFIKAASNFAVPNSNIERAIERFGLRVTQLTGFPDWHIPLNQQAPNHADPENSDSLKSSLLQGEFQLALATELPANLQELLTARLGLSYELHTQHYFTKDLGALFEQLQHLDALS